MLRATTVLFASVALTAAQKIGDANGGGTVPALTEPTFASVGNACCRFDLIGIEKSGKGAHTTYMITLAECEAKCGLDVGCGGYEYSTTGECEIHENTPTYSEKGGSCSHCVAKSEAPATDVSCEDSAAWFQAGKTLANRGCSWVALDRTRCGKLGDDDTPASASCPKACRGCGAVVDAAPVGPCEDSAAWFQAGKTLEKRGCSWVAKDRKRNCAKKDAGGVKASTSCPVTCGTCPGPGTECADSATWKYQKSKNGKGCEWVGERPTKRCKKKGKDGTKAIKSCPIACSAC